MPPPNVDDQPLKRRIQILKQSTQLLSVGTGCFVQRISANDLRRLRAADADPSDPAVRALKPRQMNTTFRRCRDASVLINDSINSILQRHDEDRKSDGAVLLAWSYEFDNASKRLKEPQLVGAVTLTRFISHADFSTHNEALTAGDYNTLQPYFSRKRYIYLDAMCSTKPGVGRLLVLKAYQYALAKKADGLVALSYTKTRGATPESKRIFERLGFDTLIETARFKPSYLRTYNMYGTWFVKKTDARGVSSIAEGGIRVCTRKGYTTDTLLWRCPA